MGCNCGHDPGQHHATGCRGVVMGFDGCLCTGLGLPWDHEDANPLADLARWVELCRMGAI